MKDILITGANGYVGSALVKSLKGRNVIAIDRVSVNDHNYKASEFFKADLNCIPLETKKKLFEFSGFVIHLAAARADNAEVSTYQSDNIEATDALIKTLNPSKIEKFIHIGSVAAIDGKELENKNIYPHNSDDWYRLSKFRQQVLVEKWAKANCVPLVILAPSAIYDEHAGQNSTNIGRLEKVVRLLRIVPSINILKSLTSMPLLINAIKDLTDIVEKKGLSKENALCKRYIVIDQPVMTVTDICKDKFNAKLVFYIPKLKFLLMLTATLIEMLGLEKRVPLSKDRVNKLFRSTAYCGDHGYDDWNNEKFKSN